MRMIIEAIIQLLCPEMWTIKSRKACSLFTVDVQTSPNDSSEAEMHISFWLSKITFTDHRDKAPARPFAPRMLAMKSSSGLNSPNPCYHIVQHNISPRRATTGPHPPPSRSALGPPDPAFAQCL